MNPLQKIRCYDMYGKPTDVAANQLEFATAVYGILIVDGNILLLQHSQTKRWHPPGDHLQRGETPDQLLRDTFRKILRADLTVKKMLHVEDQYQFDRRRKAWHIATLYYALQRPLTTVIPPLPPGQTRLAWHPLATLTREQMQFGYTAVEVARQHRQNTL